MFTKSKGIQTTNQVLELPEVAHQTGLIVLNKEVREMNPSPRSQAVSNHIKKRVSCRGSAIVLLSPASIRSHPRQLMPPIFHRPTASHAVVALKLCRLESGAAFRSWRRHAVRRTPSPSRDRGAERNKRNTGGEVPKRGSFGVRPEFHPDHTGRPMGLGLSLGFFLPFWGSFFWKGKATCICSAPSYPVFLPCHDIANATSWPVLKADEN